MGNLTKFDKIEKFFHEILVRTVPSTIEFVGRCNVIFNVKET